MDALIQRPFTYCLENEKRCEKWLLIIILYNEDPPNVRVDKMEILNWLCTEMKLQFCRVKFVT